MITLWEIIKIKLRSSMVIQQVVRFAVKYEIRCVALHNSTDLTLSRVAQDNQKMLVVTKIVMCSVSLDSLRKSSMD